MPGFEALGMEERKEIEDALDVNVLFRYEFGPQRGDTWKVREFEAKLAAYTGVSHSQAVTSGTAALKVAMASLGLGPGDEIIVPGFTFVATWEAVFDAGAEPVFADVDDTLCLDPTRLEDKITDRTKAVILVHMCGGQGDVDAIKAITDKHGLILIEDTAQAMGATVKGKHLGTTGACGCLSFDAVKTMTCGEGGGIITNDADLWQTMSEFSDHGHDHEPVGRGNESRRFIGLNYRMFELQGAIGLAQLAKLDSMIAQMRSHKKRLTQALAKVPGVSFRRYMDKDGDNATFISWFHETAEQADKFNEALNEAGCGAISWFSNTWHYYRKWEHLHATKTSRKSGWPFVREDGRKLSYPPDALPASDAVMAKLLCWQIMVNMDEARLVELENAIAKAAQRL